MSVRPPQAFGNTQATQTNPLDLEILGEKASALGRAGERVEKTLGLLRGTDAESPERTTRLKDATDAVYGYFIQRELCGLRRHQDVIREYAIPNEVLVRLGAR